MRYHVIGDEDTVLGFRYAGIPGEVVADAEAAREAFLRVTSLPDIGIVIITDLVADLIRDTVNAERFDQVLPLVVEVPGPGGPSPARQDLLALIREAVGIRV
jgi:V/A-type H+-transporting ATPase subunit F